jgi:hypothetical protein
MDRDPLARKKSKIFEKFFRSRQAMQSSLLPRDHPHYRRGLGAVVT